MVAGTQKNCSATLAAIGDWAAYRGGRNKNHAPWPHSVFAQIISLNGNLADRQSRAEGLQGYGFGAASRDGTKR